MQELHDSHIMSISEYMKDYLEGNIAFADEGKLFEFVQNNPI